MEKVENGSGFYRRKVDLWGLQRLQNGVMLSRYGGWKSRSVVGGKNGKRKHCRKLQGRAHDAYYFLYFYFILFIFFCYVNYKLNH